MEFDPIETCPYEAVHRIRRSRMQFHITICSKNFPASKMMQCPFDARHRINQVEFEYHKSHCPARESVLDYAIHDTTLQTEQKILPIDVKPVSVSDENWDECSNFKTYNPLQAIKDKPIVHSIVGLSKAKRKDHRMQERMRFNQIMENSGNQPTKKVEKEAVDKEDDEDEKEYKPLRLPFSKRNQISKAPQDKSQTLVLPVCEDPKKVPLKVEEASNVSFSSATSKNEKGPTLNKSKDSIFDKLSRTFEELVVTDEGHKKKTEPLDEQINMLKKNPSEKKTKAVKNFTNDK